MKQFKIEATFDTPEEAQEFFVTKTVIPDNIAMLEATNIELSEKNKNQLDIITNLQNNNALLKQELDNTNGIIKQLYTDITQLKKDNEYLLDQDLHEEIVKNARLEERKGFIDLMNRKYGMVSDNVKNWDIYCEQLLAMRDFNDIKLPPKEIK